MLGSAPLASEPLSSAPISGAGQLSAAAILVADADLRASARAALSAAASTAVFGGRVQRGGATLVGRATVAADLDVTYAAVAIVISTGSLRVARTIPIRGVAVAAVARAQVDAFAVSLFDDLVSNPSRRRIYAIEIQPVLLVPYEELAA